MVRQHEHMAGPELTRQNRTHRPDSLPIVTVATLNPFLAGRPGLEARVRSAGILSRDRPDYVMFRPRGTLGRSPTPCAGRGRTRTIETTETMEPGLSLRLR